MRIALLAILAALATIAPSTARAEWHRAETGHFVVYSDDRPAAIRQLAVDLETFDAMLRRIHATGEQDGAGSNKLTVFVVDTIDDVQKLCGRCPNVAGFYEGRASGSIAVTPRNAFSDSDYGLNARTVLFHEYAHHFLFGNYARAYPAWFSEGYAEFASTFRRDKLGLTIGAAPRHRAYGLFSGVRLPLATLLDPTGRKLNVAEQELIYGRGWLLTHYVMFDPARRKQLDHYLKLLNAGTPSVKAAAEAFGDLGKLDRALDGYLKARTLKALTVRHGVIPDPAVTMRPLSAGETALIDLRIASSRGVNSKTAGPLFAKAKGLAARYPDDPVVQAWIAEMAYDANDLAAADAAADRALARDPKSAHALLYKGLIGLRRASNTKAAAPAWAAARRHVVEANKLDPNNAVALQTYYDSFEMEGRPPTRNAIAGLLRAQELAPQDDGLRYSAMVQSINDGEVERARQLLKPLAYSPHRGADNQTAKLLAALEAAKTKEEAQAALAASEKAASKPDQPAP